MEFLQKLLHTITQVHPPHPMFVHFPIALTAAALFFILLAVWKRSDQFEKTAFANLALATFSVVAAGASGLYDNFTRWDGSAPHYQYKIVLASLLLVVTASTAIARWKNPELFHSSRRGLYVGAYFVSFALAFTVAFLGGVIIYGFG